MTDQKQSEHLPQAQARYSPIDARRIIVDRCPYCGETHHYAVAADDSRQRLADCFRGEYVLVFESAQQQEATP